MKRKNLFEIFFIAAVVMAVLFTSSCSNITEKTTNNQNDTEILDGKVRVSVNVKQADEDDLDNYTPARTIFPNTPALTEMTYKLEYTKRSGPEFQVYEDFESASYKGDKTNGWGRNKTYYKNGSYGLGINDTKDYSGTCTYIITDDCFGISFYYKNNLKYATVKFYIDNKLERNYPPSTSNSWSKEEFLLTEGTHTFKWEYTAGADISRSNYFCIDDISLKQYIFTTTPVAESLSCDSTGKLSDDGADILINADTYYSLTLTAMKNGRAYYSGTLTDVTISKNTENQLEFKLQRIPSASGNGNISVTLNLPPSVGIVKVAAQLLYPDLTSDINISIYSKTLDVDANTNSVTYEVENIPSGSYIAKFTFVKPQTSYVPYSESVIVSPGLTSSKTITLSAERFGN